jgi:hypothetical protein
MIDNVFMLKNYTDENLHPFRKMLLPCKVVITSYILILWDGGIVT